MSGIEGIRGCVDCVEKKKRKKVKNSGEETAVSGGELREAC